MTNKIEGSVPLAFPRTPEEVLADATRLKQNINERTVGQLLKLLETAPTDKSADQPQVLTKTVAALPPLIRAYDQYARKLEIPRETWKQAVLQPAFKQSATDPEALHRLIVLALEEGFIEESLPPAQQLVKVDPNVLRAAALHGSVLLQLKRFDEAVEVLESAAQEHGEDAEVLTNIAKAYAGLGKPAQAEELLWRALKLDPNHKDALEWYAALAIERDGKPAQAYRSIASLPDSWLAQLTLASVALEEQDLDGAMALYKEILRRMPGAPEEVFVRISADLAQRGALRQMIELFEPRFDAAKHGLLVGAHLIAAHLELNDAPAARHIFEILYALQRPDWREHLALWHKRIEEAEYGPMKQPKSSGFEFLRLANPVWAYGDPDLEALLPVKAPDACRVVLVCGSGSIGTSPMEPFARLTRFIPQFFAEELQLRTEAQSIFLAPWLNSGGFFLNPYPWKREQLKIEELNASFVLTMHADAEREPWLLQFRLWGGADEYVLDTWEQPVDAVNPVPAVLVGLKRVMQSLSLLERQPVPEDLNAPRGVQLPSYLMAIERALALGADSSAASIEYAASTFPSERFIFEDLLQLALATPRNARTRCLFLTSLNRAAARHPDLVGEYRLKLQQLQDEHPLQWGPAAVAVAMALEKL